MKKSLKKFLVLTLGLLILLTSIPMLTNATPEVTREIISEFEKSENSVDGLPFTPIS